MDSPSVDEALRSGPACNLRRDGAAPWPRAPHEVRGALDSSELKKARALGPRQRATFVSVSVAIVGAASIGLLVYGSPMWNNNKGESSVSTKVPDAASAAAAVKNLPPPDL